MMEKLHYNFDQEELVKVAGSMGTLIENGAHVKQASSDAMSREMLDSCKPDKDHFLVHYIAMGDFEKYSFNKNGDAWPKKACEARHPTFVSHGHFFREHRNRNKDQAIGQIKASCYNAPMGRIELAVWGHKKKAEDVYEAAKKQANTSVSMSARVPNDRSSITGKLCASPAEYDVYCRSRMGQWIPEHNKFAFVFNDHPTFFDISYVKNPADRIAHHLEYVGMDKAASVAKVANGVDLAAAAGVCLPRTWNQQVLIEKLASEENFLDAVAANPTSDPKALFCKYAGQHLFSGELSDAELEAFRSVETGTFFRKLAEQRVLLPLASFVAYINGVSIKAASEAPDTVSAAGLLPNIFTKIAAANFSEFENLFEPASMFMSGADLRWTSEQGRHLGNVANRFSIDSSVMEPRVLKLASTGKAAGLVAAAETPEGFSLAAAYAHYKLAALHAIVEIHGDDERNLLVAALQNR